MDNAVFVGVMGGPGQRSHQLRRRPRRQRRAAVLLRQVASFQEFQGEIQLAIALAVMVDLDNVRMLQARGDFGLGPEARQLVRLLLSRGGNRLEQHDAI